MLANHRQYLHLQEIFHGRQQRLPRIEIALLGKVDYPDLHLQMSILFATITESLSPKPSSYKFNSLRSDSNMEPADGLNLSEMSITYA